MSICNCTDITHSSWDFTAPTSTPAKVDDATIDDLSSKKVITVHTEIIKSEDKSKACSLKGLLEDMLKASWVKTDADNITRTKELIKQICDKVIKTKCTCEEKLDDTNACKDDKVIKAKEDCKSPKVWSDSECKCGNAVIINWVDGCIDPEAFNYYCKENKCGDDNDKLPENMVPTRCDYRVNEKLKYKYILSKLEAPNPEEGTYWEGDIVIKGSGSFDSPTDDSWLTRTYKQQKAYWTDMCSNISDTDIDFTTDKGLYVNQGDLDIQADLVKALLKFTSSEGGGAQFLKNYKVMIMDENNSNLGIVSLYNNNLTLDVRNAEGKPIKEITGYRVSKNSGGKISSKDAPNASVNDYRTYFRKRTSLIPLYANVTIDDNYIVTIGEPTNESIIGLGTLLERKNKPITGLGSLLED